MDGDSERCHGTIVIIVFMITEISNRRGSVRGL